METLEKLDVWITKLNLSIFQICPEAEEAFNIVTGAHGYFVILMVVLSRGSKLNVSFLMEHELQRLLRDRLFYRAFPLSLSTLCLCLSASRSSSQGGSLQEQQAGRALSHRGATQECIVCVRKTGQLGRNSAPTSSNRALMCGNARCSLPREKRATILCYTLI